MRTLALLVALVPAVAAADVSVTIPPTRNATCLAAVAHAINDFYARDDEQPALIVPRRCRLVDGDVACTACSILWEHNDVVEPYDALVIRLEKGPRRATPWRRRATYSSEPKGSGEWERDEDGRHATIYVDGCEDDPGGREKIGKQGEIARRVIDGCFSDGK